jgi:hypothetical protein
LQLQASVNLIRSLGGGWQDPSSTRNLAATDVKQHG